MQPQSIVRNCELIHSQMSKKDSKNFSCFSVVINPPLVGAGGLWLRLQAVNSSQANLTADGNSWELSLRD